MLVLLGNKIMVPIFPITSTDLLPEVDLMVVLIFESSIAITDAKPFNALGKQVIPCNNHVIDFF